MARCVSNVGWKVVSAALLCLVWLPATGAAESGEPDILVKGLVQAWNAHDMKAFANLYTEDADFVNVAGAWWKGRAEIQAKHEDSHATRFKTTTLVATGTAVRLPRADVAVIHFRWELTGEVDREGRPVPPRRGVMQIVGTKQAEGWRIISSQNTNLREPQ